MIDTHQHLIYKDKFSYEWVKELPVLENGRFHLEDYRQAAERCPIPIRATVYMEVDVAEEEQGEEARFACRLAENPDNRIAGVIAGGRPEKDGFSEYLDSIAHARLSGIRRVLHTQPDGLSQSRNFRDNVNILAERNLSFDVCVLQRQLPMAYELVKACPHTTFVLDHCGGPDIARNGQDPGSGGWEFWKTHLTRLSQLPNLSCKISGIVVNAAEHQRNTEGLRPYVETVIESFGWDRVVFGGDWPVCNLGATLSGWVGILREILQGESSMNLKQLYDENAQNLYRLADHPLFGD